MTITSPADNVTYVLYGWKDCSFSQEFLGRWKTNILQNKKDQIAYSKDNDEVTILTFLQSITFDY